jgi:hypothetical protein
VAVAAAAAAVATVAAAATAAAAAAVYTTPPSTPLALLLRPLAQETSNILACLPVSLREPLLQGSGLER